jgi:hypothetical protein
MAFLYQNKANVCKNLIIAFICFKNDIFPSKLAKIAENCDYNIDPSSATSAAEAAALLLIGN